MPPLSRHHNPAVRVLAAVSQLLTSASGGGSLMIKAVDFVASRFFSRMNLLLIAFSGDSALTCPT